MNGIKKFVLVLLGLDFVSIANAQEGYLCISEASGGVSFEKTQKKWQGSVFRNKNDKILIVKKNNRWTMKGFDSTFESDCTQPNDYGIMSCNKIFGEFNFNTKNRRYISTYIAGYIDGVDNNDNTPHIEIGICTKL
jgi:hypothetical protein